MNFDEIAARYTNYIKDRYPRCVIIVFDGYPPLSTKDQEHLRRNTVPLSTFVAVSGSNRVPYAQEHYLTLKENKVELIKFLSGHFRTQGMVVVNCDDDADTTIVETAIDKASDSTVLVVADDTDISILLLYHWRPEMEDILLHQECSGLTWSIQKAQNNCIDIKEHLLFLHAFSGCDTTSAIHRKGKARIVKLLRKSHHFQDASKVISKSDSTSSEIETATKTAFSLLYGGSPQDSLTSLR